MSDDVHFAYGNETTVWKGGSLTNSLNCYLLPGNFGFPKAVISLFKDGNPTALLVGEPGKSIKYELENVQHSDGGLYSCVSKNAVGTKLATLSVTVQGMWKKTFQILNNKRFSDGFRLSHYDCEIILKFNVLITLSHD